MVRWILPTGKGDAYGGRDASAPLRDLGIEELEALGKGWEMLVDVER